MGIPQNGWFIIVEHTFGGTSILGNLQVAKDGGFTKFYQQQVEIRSQGIDDIQSQEMAN